MTNREKKKKKKDKVNIPLPKQRPMHDVDDLLDEAKCGKLTNEEILYVAEKVKASRPGDNTDLYGLLFILGLSEATQYRELVEGFLYYPTDPTISGMALKVLFRYWGNDAQRYLNELKAFIKGVSWDKTAKVRLAAIQCTADFLKETPEKELFQLLLDLYKTSNAILLKTSDEQTDESEDAKFWLEVSFTELAIAVCKGWEDLVGNPGEPVTPLSEEFMLEVVAKAKQIIKNLK
ncbi:MAG: hypothetical protein ACRCU0_07695 [Candidatus Rhabdochlamydia sp.]